jgi:hypothetical protein
MCHPNCLWIFLWVSIKIRANLNKGKETIIPVLNLHTMKTLKTLQGMRKKISVVVVRKRTIPIERPPLVGEVSANLCG